MVSEPRAWSATGVSGFLYEPMAEPEAALVLSHGAGANARAALLDALARQAAQSAEFLVAAIDLPFRQLRPSGPPRAGDPERDRAGLRRAAELLRHLAGAVPLIIGGHSYGGRQSTMLAAEDPTVADALLLLSYPLHPPRKPTELRTAHLPSLHTPSLFVHGTRDPFGSPGEMSAALEAIPGRHELLLVQGAGHELSPPKRGHAVNVADLTVETLTRFLAGTSSIT